jgi:hypothetical protein
MTTKVRLESGRECDFNAVVNLMDDDIRESLHNELVGIASEQYFYDRYVVAHRDKYGSEFVVI